MPPSTSSPNHKVELKTPSTRRTRRSRTFRLQRLGCAHRAADLVLTLYADDDFKLKQVTDVLLTKCAKRGVDARLFDTKER